MDEQKDWREIEKVLSDTNGKYLGKNPRTSRKAYLKGLSNDYLEI